MDIIWDTGWYANRLHARLPDGKVALCGFHFPSYVPDSLWRERQLQKELPKCKRCLKQLPTEK